MCVKRYTPDNLQKVQISNQNSDCIHFSLCHWTRLMWLRLLLLLLLLRNARSFLCHEWTNLRGHIFFSPPLTHSSALLHSSHTHATITSYDLCFLRLIYHCIAPNCLSSLGELHWAPSRTWWASDERKNTLRSHQPYSKQQQGQGKLSLCAKARKTLNLKKIKKKNSTNQPRYISHKLKIDWEAHKLFVDFLHCNTHLTITQQLSSNPLCLLLASASTIGLNDWVRACCTTG